MPELPEVETICRSISPHIIKQRFTDIIIRQRQLRWPITAQLKSKLIKQTIKNVSRRAKYILITCSNGTLIIHLGMSGKLTIIKDNASPAKHDHVDFKLNNNCIIRYSDPRRFGSMHWTSQPPTQHKLLKHLGIEPLTKEFSALYLLHKASKKKTPIKSLLMNATIVVGIGNIYANEALFKAGILPTCAAGNLDIKHYKKLVSAIKSILQKAIQQGGTTLRDFYDGNGNIGSFKDNLYVYGRGGQPCKRCNTTLTEIRLAQRSTVFCPSCQKR